MMLGQEYHVFGNWFIIHFTENNGMAFGMQLKGETGKILLSIFRILAVGAIGWYLTTLVKKKSHPGLIAAISLIFVGALGNIVDCAFYGMIFNESLYQIASFMPVEGGYSSILQGKVVDMLYFPIVHSQYPSWVPFVGGDDLEFFRPVFNIADSSITVGVFILLIFQKRFFKKENEVVATAETSVKIEESENAN